MPGQTNGTAYKLYQVYPGVLLVLWMQSKDLLVSTSRAISRVLVLQLQDLLLPTLLDDAVFFALILQEFLVLCVCYHYLFLITYNEGMTMWKSVYERCGLCSCCQKQNVEDSALTELNVN